MLLVSSQQHNYIATTSKAASTTGRGDCDSQATIANKNSKAVSRYIVFQDS